MRLDKPFLDAPAPRWKISPSDQRGQHDRICLQHPPLYSVSNAPLKSSDTRRPSMRDADLPAFFWCTCCKYHQQKIKGFDWGSLFSSQSMAVLYISAYAVCVCACRECKQKMWWWSVLLIFLAQATFSIETRDKNLYHIHTPHISIRTQMQVFKYANMNCKSF